MASLTIRKLDDAVKTYLRLRSAKNHRSVEEEVRVILRELIEGREEPLTPFAVPSAPSSASPPQRTGAVPEASVTLIIGGGIAAMGRSEGRKNRWRTVALWIIAATFIGILIAVRNL